MDVRPTAAGTPANPFREPDQFLLRLKMTRMSFSDTTYLEITANTGKRMDAHPSAAGTPANPFREPDQFLLRREMTWMSFLDA